MSNVQFTSVTTDEGTQNLIVFADGRLLPPVDDTHPNFAKIRDLCLTAFQGGAVDVAYLTSLFDVAQTVADKFARLSERVTVRNGVIMLDGDPVHGTLQEQILAFLDAGEEFEPLVKFYEKLLTNPLGDVRAGLYDWIAGQRANGNFTITPEGDILGYKSVKKATPQWRTDEDVVYVPSRPGEGIVNGRDVAPNEFIEQIPGDVVEMPRSRVLHAPSQECGDGLHIGTFQYASTFYGGNTVMLVKFSPRDIVSLPDNNSSFKLRVCRYEIIEIVDAPLDVPVWSPEGVEDPVVEFYVSLDEDDEDDEFPVDINDEPYAVADDVEDADGDIGRVTEVRSDGITVRYDELGGLLCRWSSSEASEFEIL